MARGGIPWLLVGAGALLLLGGESAAAPRASGPGPHPDDPPHPDPHGRTPVPHPRAGALPPLVTPAPVAHPAPEVPHDPVIVPAEYQDGWARGWRVTATDPLGEGGVETRPPAGLIVSTRKGWSDGRLAATLVAQHPTAQDGYWIARGFRAGYIWQGNHAGQRAQPQPEWGPLYNRGWQSGAAHIRRLGAAIGPDGVPDFASAWDALRGEYAFLASYFDPDAVL